MAADKNIVLDLTNYKDRRGARVEPGQYHVQIEDVESAKSNAGNPYLTIWLRVLEGDESGATLIDRLVLTEKSLWRMVAFLQSIGVPTPRKKLSVPYRSLIGRKLLVEVEDGDPYNGTVRSEIRGYAKAKGSDAPEVTEDLPEVQEEAAPAEETETSDETIEVPVEEVNLDDIEL